MSDLPRKRKLQKILLELSFAAIAFVAIGFWQTRHHPRGVPFPSARLETLGGGTLTLGGATAKPRLIAFWAPWCGVCAAEAKNFSWVQRLVGSRAEVITVALDYRNQTQVTDFARRHALEVPVGLGTDALSQALQIEAFPTVYFVGADGTIKRSVVGYTTTLSLLARLLLS